MHLIAPLAGGVRGADNGLVRLFRRGTSTRATWYADFEASSADSSGEDIPLDSNGGANVYVNELVQVQVYDNLGELVRDFVAGDQAYAVEVISHSFTGTDYTSGQQDAALPTTDGEVLDRWLDSAGAIDWFVLYSGAAASLENAFGAIYGLFFNVKSPEFGAVGNGVVNDAAAIQAAYTAAMVRGGIVVFPPGIYNHSAEIVYSTGVSTFAVPGTVTLRCTTAGQSNMRITSALSGGPDTPTRIEGIRFDSTVTNSATQLSIGHGSSDEIHVVNCRFGGSAFATGAAIALGGTLNWRTLIRDCYFQVNDDVTCVIDTASAGTGQIDIEGCQFFTPAGAFDDYLVLSQANRVNVRGSRFNFQATSGTPVGIMVDEAGTPLNVSGCTFTRLSGVAAYAIQFVDDGIVHFADDNIIDVNSMSRYRVLTTEHLRVNTSYLSFGSFLVQSVGAGTSTINDEYAHYTIRGTDTEPTLELPRLFYAGQRIALHIFNNSGVNWGGVVQITYDGGHVIHTRATTPWPAINDGQRITLEFMGTNLGASWDWIQLSDTQAAEF